MEIEGDDHVTTVWGLPLAAVFCRRCDAAHLVPADALPTRCPLCLHGPVEPQPAYLRDEPPEQVVPYAVDGRRLTDALEKWSDGVWFRPDGFNGADLARRARQYVLPLWLVDGQVDGPWQADVGFDYQVISSQDEYTEGRGWNTRQVQETRVRWEPRAGRIARRYDNVAAPALQDHRELERRLGRYDLSNRRDYRPESIAGAAVRIPSLDPEAAWPGAEIALIHAAEDACRRAAGAEHVRHFVLDADYRDLHWTQLLLPAYVTWYQEGDRVWPVLVNGQTGRVSGIRRASARKANTIALTIGVVGLLLFAAGGLLALLGALLPPLAALGGLILILGVTLMLAAPAPALGAWMFNRRNTGNGG